MFRGSIPALATPFSADGAQLDLDAFGRLIEWQIGEGTSAIAPVGTTGESVTLTEDEHDRVVAASVEAAAGKAPVIAGAGSNDTAKAIRLAQRAERAGADAILVVSPYYNRPSQEGVYQHYKAIHDACGLPIVVYNVPPRTASDVSNETIIRLAETLPRIAAVKDASRDMERPSTLRRALGDRLALLSGEDATALGFNAHGGVGCISVTANCAPRACADLQAATLDGDFAAARAVQDRLIRLHKAMFIEPSPAPAKYGLSLLGRIHNTPRSPIMPVGAASAEEIRAAMIEAGALDA